MAKKLQVGDIVGISDREDICEYIYVYGHIDRIDQILDQKKMLECSGEDTIEQFKQNHSPSFSHEFYRWGLSTSGDDRKKGFQQLHKAEHGSQGSFPATCVFFDSNPA